MQVQITRVEAKARQTSKMSASGPVPDGKKYQKRVAKIESFVEKEQFTKAM